MGLVLLRGWKIGREQAVQFFFDCKEMFIYTTKMADVGQHGREAALSSYRTLPSRRCRKMIV